ncbi:hypothetical protein ACQPXB_33815 [Amycolatopsis sp. CA-161197]|uniref:hypothetical protein n=1 Tax=Amycolatopsis sp. CA-161197 TaxID=3239922 RepID=UPI003D8DA964
MDELGPVAEPGQKYASTCLAPGAVFAMTWHGGSYAAYVDARVAFRQYCCPSCWTALYSGVVPADHLHTPAALGHRATAAAG